MARRRIFWHLGPDDIGTRFLAHALDARRDALAEQGVSVPGTPASWELATAELLRTHRESGYRRAQVDGQAAALMRRVWKHRGTSVVSMPGLAGAEPEQVALALDGVRDVELHLVLVVRDDASRAQAVRQARLETGAAAPTSSLLSHQPPDGPAHDVDSIVQRWGRTVLPENVHVIEQTDPARVWTELSALLGVDVELPEAMLVGHLDTDRAEVLSDVVAALGERIDAPGRRTAVRDLLVGRLLTRSEDPRPAALLAEALLEVARLQRANTELIAENLQLDRKRRKHKRRLKALSRDAA